MADFVSKDVFLSFFQNKLSDEDVDGSNFTDAELVLPPDRVVAFDLHSRRYTIVGVDGLQTVEARAEGWAISNSREDIRGWCRHRSRCTFARRKPDRGI